MDCSLAHMAHQGNAADEKRLGQMDDPKWLEKYHIIDRINNRNTNGFIDTQGGITIADKVEITYHGPRPRPHPPTRS